MWWATDFRKLRTRPAAERRRLLEAALLLTGMRIAVLLFSFRRVAGWLGLVQGNARAEVEPAQSRTAAEIGWAVCTVAARLPWKESCLMRTLAAAAMIRRRAIPCTVCLGVARGEQQILAHAWLECGGVVLAGAGNHKQFTMISAFSVAGK